MSDQTESTSEFEFTEPQNEVMGDLAGKMKFVGTLLMVLGVLVVLTGIGTMFVDGAAGVLNIIVGVVYLLLGWWTRAASASFQEVVDTEGQDITNLMAALGELRRLYSLQYWIFLILLVMVVIGIVVAIIGGASS